MSNLITSKHDESCESLNASLAMKLLNLTEDQVLKQTHFFEGRYENIYVDAKKFPELEHIIQQARSYAAEILNKETTQLKIGCWINIMQQGHTTSLHSHENDDELLSGVYYLKVPEGSGHFVLHDAGQQQDVKPVAGQFLFFSPALDHEVTEHLSAEPRISIAFNIGPVTAVDDEA